MNNWQRFFAGESLYAATNLETGETKEYLNRGIWRQEGSISGPATRDIGFYGIACTGFCNGLYDGEDLYGDCWQTKQGKYEFHWKKTENVGLFENIDITKIFPCIKVE